MNDEISAEDKQTILDQVIRLTTPLFRQPGDFTIGEYIERWEVVNGHSITTGYAVNHLDRLIRAGRIEKIEDVYDPEASRKCNVYRWIEE